LESLKNLIIENDKKVVAVGECGLGTQITQINQLNKFIRLFYILQDWDRLHFCPKEVQKQ
jgi:Tat protein secretion system quality control protein TatD with DNase activity